MIKKCSLILIVLFAAATMGMAAETSAAKVPSKPEIGKPAPVFSGRLLDKKLLKLEDLLKKKNKIILVDFWATWCPPCRGEIPHLQELYKEYHKKGLVIVSVNVNEDAETIESFIQKTEMPWNHLRDIGGKISALYEVNSIPAPFLIDQNGILVAMELDLRGPNLKKTVEKFIKNLPPQEDNEEQNAKEQ